MKRIVNFDVLFVYTIVIQTFRQVFRETQNVVQYGIALSKYQ